MFDENKEMLPSYIALLGKLPTLDSTVALTATLLIYYSFEPADILNMEQRVVERNRVKLSKFLKN